MAKKKNKKKPIKVGTIKFADTVKNASNKPNRTTEGVFGGTGYYENKHKYKRSREKQKLNNELKEYL